MKRITEQQLRRLVISQELSLARRVRRLRQKSKMTQGQLAEKMGVDRKTVNRIEQNWFSPSVSTLTRLAAVLGVKPADLMKQD